MPINQMPDGGPLVATLGQGDLVAKTFLHEDFEIVTLTLGAVEGPCSIALVIPDAATAFSLMQMLRDAVYELGGIDPPLEACDEVAEYLDCRDVADWKDAKGRLTRRCTDAINRLHPSHRVVPPETEEDAS